MLEHCTKHLRTSNSCRAFFVNTHRTLTIYFSQKENFNKFKRIITTQAIFFDLNSFKPDIDNKITNHMYLEILKYFK